MNTNTTVEEPTGLPTWIIIFLIIVIIVMIITIVYLLIRNGATVAQKRPKGGVRDDTLDSIIRQRQMLLSGSGEI